MTVVALVVQGVLLLGVLVLLVFVLAWMRSLK